MYSKTVLIGNLGKDPELKQLTGGNSVCAFSLATTETWKDASGNKQEKASWHNIKLFGKLGEIAAQYLKKGSKVLIEGQISYSSWEKDGQKFYGTDIIGREMKMLGNAPGTAASEPSSAVQNQADNYFHGNDEPDDLPF